MSTVLDVFVVVKLRVCVCYFTVVMRFVMASKVGFVEVMTVRHPNLPYETRAALCDISVTAISGGMHRIPFRSAKLNHHESS